MQENIMAHMTEEEALIYLGLEKVPTYKGMDQMLSKKSSWGRMIGQFLLENYPEQIAIIYPNGTMEKIIDQRDEEAKETYQIMHKRLQKEQNISTIEDYQNRVRAEEQIRMQIMETITREILYRPLEVQL